MTEVSQHIIPVIVEDTRPTVSTAQTVTHIVVIEQENPVQAVIRSGDVVVVGMSLGVKGDPGVSAYASAVAAGYVGAESEWRASLKGADGAPGSVTVSAVFADSTERDAYYVANPAELINWIVISTGGAYQRYETSAWQDITPVFQGLPGPPGANDAASVTYTGAYPNVGAALDALLYVAPAISSFSLSVTTVEIGSTVTAVTANWAFNKAMTGATLTDVAALDPQDTTRVFTGLALTANKNYTLTCTDGANTAEHTESITFLNRGCYGVSTVATGYTSADVMALANKVLSGAKGRTFTVTAGAGEYITYSYPARLGTVTFYVGGFDGGFEAPETTSVTNASGYTENYYTYRSTNHSLGTTTVTAV